MVARCGARSDADDLDGRWGVSLMAADRTLDGSRHEDRRLLLLFPSLARLRACEKRALRQTDWPRACMNAQRGDDMLFLVFLCLVLWFLGLMTTTTLGGLLHILLVFAIVFFLIHIIQGRSIGNA